MDKLAETIGNHFIFPYKPYKIEVVGSVARGAKDIDYLITVHSMNTIEKYANYLKDISMKYPYEIVKVNKCGTYNCYFSVKNTHTTKKSVLINTFLTDKNSYFYTKLARLYDTIYYRKLARDKGLLLNNTGLYDYKTEEPIKQTFKSVNSIIEYLES